jgi:hypothetical protein
MEEQKITEHKRKGSPEKVIVKYHQKRHSLKPNPNGSNKEAILDMVTHSLRSPRIMPLAFALLFSFCHIHRHGLSSSHIHTEQAKSPLPNHLPFTTSRQSPPVIMTASMSTR